MLGPKIAHGREADVYAWGDDAVIKLFRPGFGGHAAEAAALRRLDGTGAAPRLVDTVDIDGRCGLVMQRIDGVDMLAHLQRRPWHLVALAHMLARAALRIHQVPAPPGLADQVEVLDERITAADLDPRFRGYASQLLRSLPTGDRLCHGDLHPGNAILTAGGASIIDWAAATRGTPASDVARTLLLLRQADPLPDTPVLSRLLISAGRSVFAAVFDRTYRQGAPQPPRRLVEWTVVHAAARLAEGLPAERDRLVGIVEAAYRVAERGNDSRRH
jgi:aminoglycoside phosphotransferase (APT) family kinase protein